MKNKLSMMLLSAALMLTLTACSGGRAAEISAYRKAMESFFARYEAYNAALSSIDPAAPASSAQLTASIDKMLADAEEMVQEPVPEEFRAVTVHIEGYAGHLRAAASSLHAAFDGEAFDPMSYSEALPELEAAGSELQNVITVLRTEAQ